MQIVEAIKKVTVEDVNRVAKKYLLVPNSIVATLKPSASGAPVSSKGFGGAEVTTAAPTKPVTLPDWAEAAVKSLKIPEAPPSPADLTLSNGLRLIVRTEKASPTVTVIGSVKHESALETPPDKEGADGVLAELFSYGTQTRDRIAFQKALDDIAASETGGTNFNLKVLKQYFAKGVELLADNGLHPALPPEAFQIVRDQSAQLTAGRLASPGYRTGRAIETALLPQNDPALREATPKSISALNLEDIKDYYAKVFRPDMTTIAVIGDITTRGSQARIREVVRELEECRRQTRGDSPGRSDQPAGRGKRAGSDPGAGLGCPRFRDRDEPLSSGLLRAATRRPRAGRRVLCDAAVQGSPSEEGVCLQRRQFPARYRNAGDVFRDVRMRSGKRLEGAKFSRRGTGSDAHDKRQSGRAATGQGLAAAPDHSERIE